MWAERSRRNQGNIHLGEGVPISTTALWWPQVSFSKEPRVYRFQVGFTASDNQQHVKRELSYPCNQYVNSHEKV